MTGFIGFTADQVTQAVSGHSLNIDLVQTLWEERDQVGAAIAGYGLTAISVVTLITPIAIASIVRPPVFLALSAVWTLVPVFALASTIKFMHLTRKDVVEAFPAPIGVVAKLAIAATPAVRYQGARKLVEYPGKISPPFKKVVYIVDESVRADYMGLNSSRFDNTPFLSSHKEAMANFGMAMSSYNCSQGSRYVLRTGLREDQIPDIAQLGLRESSIWQFAKHAGFRTVHIDAFRLPNVKPHSFMNPSEMLAIDKTIVPTTKLMTARDDETAERLLHEIGQPGPQFIFVEKFGIHFPYDVHVPSKFDYDPSGLDKLPARLTAERSDVVATYLKAVRWRVDRFFEAISELISRGDTLVIYTSDHGQAMFECDYDATHCSGTGTCKGEGIVPLLVFTGNEEYSRRFKLAAQKGADHASHFQLFPTLLEVFGYDPDWVRPQYGASLFDTSAKVKRRFSTTNPFYPAANWIEVD